MLWREESDHRSGNSRIIWIMSNGGREREETMFVGDAGSIEDVRFGINSISKYSIPLIPAISIASAV